VEFRFIVELALPDELVLPVALFLFEVTIELALLIALAEILLFALAMESSVLICLAFS